MCPRNPVFPSKVDPKLSMPSAELATQVLGGPVSAESSLPGVFVVSEGIKGVLRLIGRPLESFGSVLDFGCGCGRILRWFEPYSEGCRFTGSDISEPAIEWDRRNLPFGEFATNGMEPPLDADDESFDLIYGISVVTHLGEELQFAWLSELARVLRPGGIAILTVMGDELAAWKLSGDDLAEFRRKGHFYKKV